MQRFQRFAMTSAGILAVGLPATVFHAGLAQAQFSPPAGGWDYAYEAGPGQGIAGTGAAGALDALDGSWGHSNGSDEWDGSEIGAGRPGGASLLEESYLRIQDTGDPRDYALADPGSNRKLYLGRDITTAGAAATVLNDGATLNFRVRVPSAAPLDEIHVDGGSGIVPYAEGGDGYLIHDGGKGNIGLKQQSGGVISFALAVAADTGGLATGLLTNNLNGTAPSGDVDSGEAGTPNVVVLDPTQWHDVWVTIAAGGAGTHQVTVYLDGDATSAAVLDVTAGNGSDFADFSYIALGAGSTGQSGAIDVDYIRFKSGVHAPPRARIEIVSDSTTDGTGNNNDDTLVALLEGAGYSVGKVCMNQACRKDATSPFAAGNEAKLAALEAADLVIISRRTGSGSYDGDRIGWNTLSTPVLLMSAFLSRGNTLNRFGWHDSDQGPLATTETMVAIEAGQEAHPFVAPFTSPITVLDLAGAPTPGQVPSAVALPLTDPVPGGAVLGRMAGRPFVLDIPAGTDFTAGNTAGGPYGAAGGRRVFLATWSYDAVVNGSPGQFSQFTTQAYRCLFLNIVSNMLGLGDDTCTVAAPVAAVSRQIEADPCASRAVTVTLAATNVLVPNTVTDTFPASGTVTDAGGGTVAGNAITFNLAGDPSGNATVSYVVELPDENLSFSGVINDDPGNPITGQSTVSQCPFPCMPAAEEVAPEIVSAFAFGSRILDCPTRSDPTVSYTMVHHSAGNNAAGAVDALQYDPVRGWGFEVLNPGAAGRGEFERFGPFDDSPNSRTRFSDACPEELYDSFVGFKDHPTLCNLTVSGNETDPCTADHLSCPRVADPNNPCPPNAVPYVVSGGVFRVDVPNGFYRFVGAFGEADNPHTTRVLVEDGGSGPPAAIGPRHATLVGNHDQAQFSVGQARADRLGAGVFARVGFNCRVPPLGDGAGIDPVFISQDANGSPTGAGADGVFGSPDDPPPESPTLEVTQGYIRLHLLQGNSNGGPGGNPAALDPRNGLPSGDVNGADIVLFELWEVPGPSVEPCDTHCAGIEVSAVDDPAGNVRARAIASDDTTDPITYTFTADDGLGGVATIGPQPGDTAIFDLLPGTYTVSVTVSDATACDPPASDAVCTASFTVPAGGRQRPGDCNQDGKLDISDPLCLLGFLFLGTTENLPCGDGSILHAANLVLLDGNGDARTDLSDVIHVLFYLFGACTTPPCPPHVQGTDCILILDCPQNGDCQ